MPEHRIRLRAAWDRLDPGDAAARRVDLPTTWAADDAARSICLRRSFGRPRVGPDGELFLELADVPGLMAARLNGAPLVFDPELGKGPGWRIAVGDRLEPRNLLELDVDLAATGDGPWGSVALVVAGGPR